MYLLAPAGGVVLTLGVAFKFLTPGLAKIIFPVRRHMTLTVLVRRKTKIKVLSFKSVHTIEKIKISV